MLFFLFFKGHSQAALPSQTVQGGGQGSGVLGEAALGAAPLGPAAVGTGVRLL